MQFRELEYSRCLKCNRLLRTKEARFRGYGSCCWRQHLLEMRNNSNRLLKYLELK